MNKKRLIRSVVILCVALGFSAGLAWMQIQGGERALGKKGDVTTTRVAGVKIGGPFSLIDQDGRTVDESILAGKYNLVYFGFTFCPAICPTELQKMNVVLGQLGPLAGQVQPVFITIDPERDTPAVMKTYVAQFNPRLIGLSGSVDNVQAALKAYKVYARKVDDPAMTEYTMDHSSYIYFIGPDGALLGMYGMTSKPSQIVDEIRAALAP